MINVRRSLLSRIALFVLSVGLAIACHLPARSQPDALALASQAQQLYNTGQLTQAVAKWQSAATAFEVQGDRLGRTKSLINQSQVLQDLGLYPRACNVLLAAFVVEAPDCSTSNLDSLIQTFTAETTVSEVESIGLRSLANILQRRGELKQAQDLLILSSKAIQDAAESDATLLTLGNVRQKLGERTRDRWSYDKITEIIARQDPQLALEPYSDAFATYRQVYSESTVPITQIQAQLNHLSLLIEIEDWWQQQIDKRLQSWQRFEETRMVEIGGTFAGLLSASTDRTTAELIGEIERNLQQLRPSHQGVYAQINYAHSLMDLGQTARVDSVLQNAWQQAVAIEDRLGQSYALGYLGRYYGKVRGELSQAIALTNRALMLAEAENSDGNVPEISYLWQSQLGQFLKQAGRSQEALAAYMMAFDTLQSLRTDLNANDREVQFDFRQEVKPVYLELASLLLSQESRTAAKSLSSANSDSSTSDSLEIARQVIESLQIAELDNFFQDPCLETANRTITIDELDPQAAVIYPIVLSDRLEVILSIAGKPLQRFTTDVASTTVEQTLEALSNILYNPSINNSAVNILSTTPVDPRELAENTQTLLPMLQQVYSWSVEPLESELAAGQIETLVFVLSGKLQSVPMAALYDGKQYLLEKYGVALAPSLQLLDTKPVSRSKLKVLAAGLSRQVEIQGEIFPALDNVPEELKQIEVVFPQSQLLLNREFTISSIEQQLESGFPVVHLATHGVFSSNPEQTFIITGDRNKIGLDTISNLFSSISNRPELIVLSACDTATGDERAVLGLAGVTVRSGSTTLASLWSVDDASTTKLVSRFYRELENPTTKKVAALRQAQLSLIDSLRINPPLAELKELPPHPYYWSPYVLVGNWQ